LTDPKKPYKVYEVLKPFDVEAARIAPWFGEDGLGIQYFDSKMVQERVDGKLKFLKVVK